MSLIAGSRSNGSSGPSPKTSSMSSPRMRFALGQAERHAFLGDQIEEQRPNLGFGAGRSAEASASRFSRFSSFR